MAEAGFRVLRYDLYGRGYSDRPDTVYDAELFDRQLLNLLTALNVDQSVDLIGFSMGGAIAVIFTDRRPAMVRKLGLIDPAGFPPKRSLVTRLGQAPILGELLICLHYRPKRFQKELWVQMQYKGFKRALLSTVRHGPLGDLSETYKRVGE